MGRYRVSNQVSKSQVRRDENGMPGENCKSEKLGLCSEAKHEQ